VRKALNHILDKALNHILASHKTSKAHRQASLNNLCTLQEQQVEEEERRVLSASTVGAT
jgi:hypothetical protein